MTRSDSAPPALSRHAPPGDQATVSVLVAVARAQAFEIFTSELDSWWRRGKQYRFLGRTPGTLYMESRLGGRIFESVPGASGDHVFEAGRITVWEPPERLVFTWRIRNFAPDESTEVEVRFEPVGASTRVIVQHRGWAALRADHPARHGVHGAAFSRTIGLWWADVMTGLREYAAEEGRRRE